jgi:hypothetical protein
MKRVYLFFLLQLTHQAFSQKPPAKFGDIPMEDMQMKRYSLDTTASALILFDRGECQLNEQLQVVYKRHTRIKFLTKTSINQWASKTIFLTRNEDGVSRLKAVAYNLENGEIVESKMEETSIFKTKHDRYTDENKFTIPNVKEGSVIEYSYVIRTSASLLPSWQFQHEIPTAYSEYEAYIPKEFTFRSEMKGFLPISDHIKKNDGAWQKWIMKDVPAFKEEPYTANSDDYISKIDFHIREVFIPGRPIIKFGSSWLRIVNDLVEDQEFGVQIKTSGFLKNTVAEITTGLIDDEQKVKAIYDFVKSKIEWNQVIDKIPDHSFKKVIDEKRGSTSEINLLMVSMMRKAGLKSYPVLLSTRKHGLINPFYPRFQQFNDVICLVKSGEKKILLDATDRKLPMNALPERCLNGEGLVVSKDEMEWVPLVSIRSRKVINADYKLSESGEIVGKVNIKRDGLDASSMREAYKDLGKEEYIKEFLSGKSWELTNSNFDNLENPNQSANETHEVSINDHTQVAGNIIYLNPYVLGRMEENLFKSEQRLYPVDYSTPIERIYMAKIEIPDGFGVEELPKAKMLVLPSNGGKFVYSASQMGSTINFVSQFIINKSVFTAEEYPHLREFYNLVVAKQAEQIVLKKKQ